MIIFMGVTGAGKSIQGQLLADVLGVPWISTGELLRKQHEGQPDEAMMAGKLKADDHMIEIVSQALSSVSNNECVLDGFPRTHKQAEWLIEQIKDEKIDLQAVIELDVSQPVMRARLQSRGRPDDTYEAINQRFLDFQQQTLPLVEELRTAGISVLHVDGERPINVVHSSIVSLLGIA